MAPKDNCFLETTAVIDYIFHTKNFDRLVYVLNNYDRKITSNYVKMEIKRGFLQYLVALHNKAVQLNRLSELTEYIHNLSSTLHRNRLSAILQILTEFYKKMEDDEVKSFASSRSDIRPSDVFKWQKRQIELFLRNKIRRSFKSIDAKLDDVINPMKCYSDIKEPFEKGRVFDNSPTQCTGSVSKCDIQKFFQDNSSSFNHIYAKLKTIKNPDTETTQRIASLNNIFALIRNSRNFSNHEPARVVKRCWHCGDAILAVTAPTDHDVINNNTKHYDPICDAINKASQSY